MTSLPKPSSTTGYVDVSILTGGELSVPRNMVHKDGPEDENICPSYSFLIENKTLGKKALFDLGVYKVFYRQGRVLKVGFGCIYTCNRSIV
jgi:hypothetical protein